MASAPHYHYYCFPIAGLTCGDADDPSDFLFSDATLLKGAQILELCGQVHSGSIRNTIIKQNQYLVVRLMLGSGVVEEDLFYDARLRAKELMAGIAIPLLAYSDFTFIPSLSTEVFSGGENPVVHFDDRTITYTHEHVASMPIHTSSLHYTRERLLEVLSGTPFTDLTKLLLLAPVRNTWTKCIRTAASVLYTSINQPTATGQFFGCYSAMEVLLDFGKQDGLLNRARVLIGNELHDLYSVAPVTEALSKNEMLRTIRNNIAHRGQDCSMDAVFCCVRMAVNVLSAVAYYHTKFSKREELCRTADLVFWLQTQSNVNDPLKILEHWNACWTNECLWQPQPSFLVYYFGLYKSIDAGMQADFVRKTACALYVLREWNGGDEEEIYLQLKRAMYHESMPFQTASEAWAYVGSHPEEIEEDKPTFPTQA